MEHGPIKYVVAKPSPDIREIASIIEEMSQGSSIKTQKPPRRENQTKIDTEGGQFVSRSLDSGYATRNDDQFLSGSLLT